MKPLRNDRLKILSLITSKVAYLPFCTTAEQPKTCQTCRNKYFFENCKYKKKEKLPKEVTHSAHTSGPSSLSTMGPPIQMTLGQNLTLQLPSLALLPLMPNSSPDLMMLAAMVEDFQPIHAPLSDPSLFHCTFYDAILLGYYRCHLCYTSWLVMCRLGLEALSRPKLALESQAKPELCCRLEVA
jgi:hypothetical protein